MAARQDVDCFMFQGLAGDTILLALDTDSTGPVYLILELQDMTETALQAAGLTGLGGDEFLENSIYQRLARYTCCVWIAGGSARSAASYGGGIM